MSDTDTVTTAPEVPTTTSDVPNQIPTDTLSGSAPSTPVDLLGAAPDMHTVQGANGPVQVNTANPEFNQDQTTPDVSKATTAGSGSMWQKILLGALTGLAGVPQNGKGGFFGGLVGGAGAELKQEQLNKENDLQREQQNNANENEADVHQSHLANGLLVNMQIAHKWDLMHPDYQKQAVESMSAYNATLQANGVKPSFTGSEADATTQAQKLITSADPNQRFTYRVLPSISQKGQFDVIQVPTGSTTQDTTVQMLGADGKMHDQKVIKGTPWATIDAINSQNQKANLEIGAKHREDLNEQGTTKGIAQTRLINAQADKAENDNKQEADQNLIDQIGTGKIAPDRMAYLLTRNPGLVSKVVEKYHDFDSSKVAGYVSAYKDFTSGKTSIALNAGGTALQHLAELKDLNTAASRIPGTPAHAAFNNKLDTVAGELVKFYGMPDTDKSISAMKSTLGGVSRDSAIVTQAKSMSAKLDSYEQQWRNAAPSASYEAQMPQISDAAKAARARLLGQSTPAPTSQHKVDGVYNPVTGKVEPPKGQ